MLTGKNIIIAGAGGLIGRTLTVAALENGANVVAAGRSMKEADFSDLDAQLRRRLHCTTVDITKPESVEALFETKTGNDQPFDAIVNCAFPKSDSYGAKFEDVTYDDFCNNLVMHQGGAFLVCQKAAAYFEAQGGGNIINFSSIYGVMAPRFEIYEGTQMTKEIEYALSKSSIIHLTRYLAKYLKGKNIRVNCISPGGVLNDEPSLFLERYNQHCSGKGMLDGDDLSGVFLFLLSDQSGRINGQNIVVDDGFSL